MAQWCARPIHGYRGRHARECLPKDCKTGSSYSFDVYVISQNTEENSQLSPVTENCYTSINQVPSMLKEQRLVPLNLLNSFQKKPLAPANPHFGPWGGSEEQCWDRKYQPLLPSYWGPTSTRSDAGIISHSAVRSVQTQASLCFSFERIMPSFSYIRSRLSSVITDQFSSSSYPELHTVQFSRKYSNDGYSDL